jgi:cephalosporin-C deacetylase
MPDVPFLCDIPRATRLVDTLPYTEIVTYLRNHRDRVDQAFRTLSYFDGATLATRATCPALFSVALMDDIVPPSAVYATRNAWAGRADLEVYQFNGHDSGGGHHRARQLQWLGQLLATR